MNEDNIDRNVINTYNGGQVIVANDNATVYAVQNNCRVNANSCVKFQNNKKQDYIDNWNSRLFLHTDNDERPITLADAFIVPDYDYRIQVGSINFSDNDTLDEAISKFMKYDRSSNMLIVGVPGIGKTSIVSWIANKYKENNDIIILRFRDWKRDELKIGLLNCICYTLDCSKRDLENKVIILDGFDELKALNEGEILIRDFFYDNLDFWNFKIIVTSRKDYIEDHLFQHVFKVKPFDTEKIEKFYTNITGNKLNNVLSCSNKDVLGIPVILYMAIMSDIDITKEATKPELYNKIFAEKGGIFDKFSYCGVGYDYGNQILRDRKNIKEYLEFLQNIAFKMYDEDNLSLRRDEEKIPQLIFQGSKIGILEFPIKNFFANTISRIEFVHKSIYEYFVSEHIIKHIVYVLASNNYKENLADIFGKKLIKRILTPEIKEFLKYKIVVSSLNDAYDKIVASFQLMLEDGMTYYTNVCYKNVIECEMTVFANMLEIIHLWEKEEFIFNILMNKYLRHKVNYGLNLKGMKKIKKSISEGRKVILVKGVDLNNTYLSKADLSTADLSGADLYKADLSYANLKETIFCKAILKETNLKGACIEYSVWCKSDIQNAMTQLKSADFSYIFVIGDAKGPMIVSRDELFSGKKFW